MAYEGVGGLVPVYLFSLTSFILSEATVLDDLWFSEVIMMLLASEPDICSWSLLTCLALPYILCKSPITVTSLGKHETPRLTVFLLLCKVLSLSHTCYAIMIYIAMACVGLCFIHYTVLLSSWYNDSKWWLGKNGIPDSQSFFESSFLKKLCIRWWICVFICPYSQIR